MAYDAAHFSFRVISSTLQSSKLSSIHLYFFTYDFRSMIMDFYVDFFHTLLTVKSECVALERCSFFRKRNLFFSSLFFTLVFPPSKYVTDDMTFIHAYDVNAFGRKTHIFPFSLTSLASFVLRTYKRSYLCSKLFLFLSESMTVTSVHRNFQVKNSQAFFGYTNVSARIQLIHLTMP